MGKLTKKEKQLVLSAQELDGMRIRKDLLDRIEADYAIHRAEYERYVHHVLEQHECSGDKEWNVSLKDGTIHEVQKPAAAKK